MAETTTHFVGRENRECGEHRTVGYRAWCFADSEWCYPAIPCKGCELPTLRAAIERVRKICKAADRYEMEELVDNILDELPATAETAPHSPSPAPSPVSAERDES